MARFVEVGLRMVNVDRVDYVDGDPGPGAVIVFAADNRLAICAADWEQFRRKISFLGPPYQEGPADVSGPTFAGEAPSEEPYLAHRGP